MNSRIIPLNLPAKLAEEVEGNPVASRLESAIANCFPGLDDVRNLDRRFFPGLIFSFVRFDPHDVNATTGARLVAVDTEDPDLPTVYPDPRKVPQKLLRQIASLSDALKAGTAIFLDAVTVAGVRIDFRYETGEAFNWDVSWRIIRSLKKEEIEIQLGARPQLNPPFHMTLKHARRAFQNKNGEISAAFKAGELTQSLCSPWQHDFRDCSCNYWASNHPDIVLPSRPATIEGSSA